MCLLRNAHHLGLGVTADAADRDVGLVTIDVLPDNVLLDIFDLCLDRVQNVVLDRTMQYQWQRLAHVCRRWKDVVSQSPRRLDLHVLCTERTNVKAMVNAWPALPLIIWIGKSNSRYDPWLRAEDVTRRVGNIIVAFEQRDRISRISCSKYYHMGTLLSMMQEPLPALTSLDLVLLGRSIPDSFLGGSAPQLRYLHLDGASFKAIPKLLLSATSLVTLTLRIVPHYGHVLPDAMANCLSASIRLERFELRFNDSESRTASYLKDRHPFSSTPAVLPALTSFDFKGMCIYLEDLVARFDAVPLLCDLHIQFFKQPTFRTPRLSWFISRAPKLQALNEARVAIFGGTILVTVPSPSDANTNTWPQSSHNGNFTQRLAAFVSGATLYRVLVPISLGGTPLHGISTVTWAKYREHPVVGTFTPIFRGEESLLIQEICAKNRACPARARRGKARKGNRSVTRSSAYFHGRAPAIGTGPSGHRTVCLCATAPTALRKSYTCFQMGHREGSAVVNQ